MKITACCLLLTILGFGHAIVVTPDQCLRKIATAMDEGDAAAFAQLIDMDAIANQAMDMFVNELGKSENAPALSPMLGLLFSQSAGQGMQAIRNLLKQEARAFVLNGVQSGAFAGKQFPAREQQGYFAPLFSSASMGRKEIRAVGEPVADDEGWFMPFTVHDYGNDQDYALIGRFVNNENGACLTNIENLDQIFNQIKREIE